MVSTFSRTKKKEGSRIKISNVSSEKRCFNECLLIVSDTRWYTRTLLFMLAFALRLRPQSRSFIKRYHKIPLKRIEMSLGCKIKLNEKHQSLSFLPSVFPLQCVAFLHVRSQLLSCDSTTYTLCTYSFIS